MPEPGTGTTGGDNPQLKALDAQIKAHQDADNNRSWIGYVASQVWHGDRTTFADLKQVSQDVQDAQTKGDSAKVTSLLQGVELKVDADKKAVNTQNEIGTYTSAGLKMAAVFTGIGRFRLGSVGGMLGMEGAGTAGAIGMASSIGLFAADKAKVGDDFSQASAHLLTGAGEGLFTKGLMNSVMTAGITDPLAGRAVSEVASKAFTFEGMTSITSRTLANPVGKGVMIGASSRGSQLAFSGDTYRDESGNTSALSGVKNVLAGTFDPKAMAIDGALFGLTSSFANLVTGGAAARPFYHNIVTSGTLGVAGGTYGEINRQWNAGQPLDWSEVGRKALLEGAVYTVAGMPGGIMADPAFRKQPVETVKSDVSRGLSNAKQELGDVANSVRDAFTPPGDFGGLTPALAMTGGGRALPGSDVRALMGSRDVLPLSGPNSNIMAMSADSLFDSYGILKPGIISITDSGTGRIVDSYTDKRREAREKTSPEELARGKDEVEQMLTGITNERPSEAQMRNAYAFFKAHPELDTHVADLYFQHHYNVGMRRLIEGFYSPEDALYRDPSLARADVRDRFNNAVNRLSHNKEAWNTGGRQLRLAIEGTRRDIGADLTPAVEQFGRLTRDGNFAYMVDLALTQQGQFTSNFSGTLKDFVNDFRSMPLTPAQVEFIRNGGTTAAPTSESRGAIGDAIERARGASLVGPDVAPETRAKVDAAVEKSIQTKIDKLMGDLKDPDPKVSTPATVELARPDILSRLNNDQFNAWAEGFKSTTTAGERYAMISPEIKALAPEVVRDFLTGEWTGASATADLKTQILSKYDSLQKIAKAYADEPDAMAALVRLGKNDVRGVSQVIENSMDFKNGKLFKAYAVKELPNAESLQNLAGPVGMTQAILRTAVPDLADRITAMAATDPKFDLKGLAEKLQFPKNAEDSRQFVREMFAPGKPEPTLAQLNPTYIMNMASPGTIYYGYPEAGKKLVSMAEGKDISALTELFTDPYKQQQQQKGPRGPKKADPEGDMNKAYKNLLGELIQRGATFEQLQDVARALKKVALNPEAPPVKLNDELAVKANEVAEAVRNTPEREGKPGYLQTAVAVKAAEVALAKIISPDDHTFNLASKFAQGIIEKNTGAIAELISRDKPKAGILAAPPAPTPPPDAPPDAPAEPPKDTGPADKPDDPPPPEPNPDDKASGDPDKIGDADTAAGTDEAAQAQETARKAEVQAAYDSALETLDNDWQLGGDPKAFAQIQSLFQEHPINPEPYLPLLDGLENFSSKVLNDVGIPTSKSTEDAMKVAQMIAEHVAEHVPEGTSVKYEAQNVSFTGSGDVSVPVIEITLPGETQPIRGVPAMDTNGLVSGLTPISSPERVITTGNSDPQPDSRPQPDADNSSNDDREERGRKKKNKRDRRSSGDDGSPSGPPLDQSGIEAAMAQLEERGWRRGRR